ncbi:MAG: cyclic nucleotide-binding domain-containing protein [Cyanobacteria bacterium P01_H01_bin.15]
MSNPLLRQAFLAGIASACSMPLGSLTSVFWQPKRRVTSFLMAFGGGALLAAVGIDLVGHATEQGHILELVLGSILGSVMFTLMDRIINSRGGFLRKSSTILTHLTQQEQQRVEKNIARLRKIPLFRPLSHKDLAKLVDFLLVTRHSTETSLYRQGDPSESLYIIERGGIEILVPQPSSATIATLGPNHMAGMKAFLTGCPHHNSAIAKAETKLNVLHRFEFEELLETSPELAEHTAALLQSEEIADYLRDKQGLSEAQVYGWVKSSVSAISQRKPIPPAADVINKTTEFLEIVSQIRRFPIFKRLTAEEIQEIADRLIYWESEAGQIFFQPEDISDRLFIIHTGEIEIIYPKQFHKPLLVLTSDDVFGELSFAVGGKHTVTAIAKTDVGIWALTKQNFTELLQQFPILEENVRHFLQQAKLRNYLQTRQNFDPERAGEWVQKALATMNAKHLIPSATAMAEAVEEHGNAPMAIWLGLLMDGIPEALTIGAHLIYAPMSPTLLAGLFVANYPEAFSSSQGMRELGFSWLRIFIMWGSIMLITGILAALGVVLFAEAPANAVSLLGAIAAGAMLTVISETMLPEAYAKGGSIVGISTILGFLTIIVIQSSSMH